MRDIYNYQKPQTTYTLEQFINCQSDNNVTYHNLSYVHKSDGFESTVYNVLSDYINEIREEYCMTVGLDKDQLFKYSYRPKLLSFDVYGDTELFYIILLVNDMSSFKEFTKDILLMPTKAGMAELTKRIFNANKDSIAKYNEKNNES